MFPSSRHPRRAAFLVALCASVAGCSGIETRWERAAAMVEQMHVQHAVDRYREDRGEAPTSLNVLVPEYLAALPDDLFESEVLGYSAAEGEVSIAPRVRAGLASANALPVMIEQDRLNLERIEDAIDSYWAMYRTYPQQLNSLVPSFMASLPTVAATGEPYRYFADTGEVYHPSELFEELAGREPGSVEGQSTPSAETLTKQPPLYPTPGRVLQEGEKILRQYEAMLDDLDSASTGAKTETPRNSERDER